MKQTKHVKAARAFLLAAAAACLFPTVTAYAVEGWNKVGDEWQYLNREDQPVTNAFKKSKEELFNLRFQNATGQLDNSSRIKTVKRDIARMYTVLRERELGITESPVQD